MAGPWEAYQSQAEEGPWTQFQASFPPIVPNEPPPDTGFTGALKSSYERMKGEGALLAGKVGLMSLPEAEEYKKQQDTKAEKAFKPTDKGWTEAPITKLKELAGGSLPYMVAPLAAGAAAAVAAPEAAVLGGLATAAEAAGFLGATAASATQFTGSNLARQMEEGKKLEDTSLLKAGATAVPQALLDTASTFITPGVGRILGRAGIKVGEKEAAEIAKKGILSTAGEYAWQGAKIFGIEGATEAGQQFLERLQAGLNLTDEQARKEYYDNFLGGAILGGVMGGAGHAYEKAFPKKAAQELPDTPPENKKEAEDAAIKILALPAPEEIIADTRRYDPVMNPLGNFIDEDLKDILTPEQIKRINEDRKEAGKPKINSYSIEDVADAIQNSTDDKGNPLTTEAQQGILNSLLTFKSGYDGTLPITPDLVLQMAEEKNVEPNTQGFNDFLTRVTGLDDLNQMQPPQLYAAWKALSGLEDSPTLRILPQGTNAVRFTEKQYANALSGLETVFGELGTDALSPTSVKQELKDFSGLERDADVDALYRAAVQRGDLEENITQRKVADGTVKDVTDVSFTGKTEALPSGFDIRHQAFKQGEIPEHYEVRNHRVVMGRAATAEEAQKILEEQTKVNAEVAKKPEAAIKKLQKDIESRNRVLAEKRATGYFDSDGYRALEAHLNGLNRRAEAQISQLQNDIKNLTNPLSIVPSQTTKPVIGKKHVFYEGEKPLASFADKYQAEEYGMMRKNEKGEYAVSDAMLQQIIDSAPTTKGILPKRYAEIAKKELARRQGTAPKGIEVRKSIYNPEVDAALDKLRQTLLPQLKKFGLEKVGLRIVNSIADGKADGEYVKNLITIALDAKNPMGVLRHESIHALKDLGAFTPQEWKVLENKAKSEWVDKYIKKAGTYKAYQDAYKAENKTLDGFDEYINEEAIAEAFKDFANTKPPAGLIGNIFYRIGEMLRGIANVFKRLGFTSSDQIFRKIEAGEMKVAAEPTATERKSFRREEPEEAMKVVFEVAPDPNNEQLSERWNSIPQDARLEISNRVAEKIVGEALRFTGFDGKIEKQVGSYLNDTNPSFALVLEKGDPVAMAKFLGHALSQDSMMVLSPNAGKGLDATGAITVSVGEKTADEINAIYQKLRKIRLHGEQPIGGQSTVNGEMIILNYSNVETEKLAREIDYALGREYNVEHTEIYTAFPEKKDYDYASTKDVRTEEERNLRKGSDSLRAEASRLLEDELETYRPPEPTVRPSGGGAKGIVLGEKQEGALSYEGTHYGKVQSNTLVGRMYGSGIRGAESERLKQSDDPRIRNRVYFYIPRNNGTMPLREAGLGPHIHKQKFDNILGPSPEMNQISKLSKGDSNKFESLIVDAGFDGYAIPDMGVMVILNHNVPVNYEGKTGDGRFSLRAPPKEYESNALNILEGNLPKPDLGKKPTVNAIGAYLDGLYPESLDFNNPEDFALAINKAKEEVKHQMSKENSGLDWYDEDIAEAFRTTARAIPELKKPNNRVLFTIIAGIMSPETTARDNWVIAAQAFKHYIATGEIPGMNPASGKLWAGGVTSPNKRTQLNFLNSMVKDLGQKGALNWLTTDHTVAEINEFRQKYGDIKSGIGGKATDMVPALYAFGPKVGPFVSNLNGIHDVTVDKWMIRTFNRYFGTVIGANGDIADAPTEPQRRAVKTLINEVANDANIKPYQAQSLLWFFEQNLYRELGVPAPSYAFSDGARKFLDQDSQGRTGSGEAGAGGNAPSTGSVKYSIRAPETPEFKRWFGNSTIVDKDGKAKVMYHGTARDITEFKPKQANAIFVTDKPQFAESFGESGESYMIKELFNNATPEERRDWTIEGARQAMKNGNITKKEFDELKYMAEATDATFGLIPYSAEEEIIEILKGELPSRSNVMPVFVRAERPFNYSDPEQVKALVAKLNEPKYNKFLKKDEAKYGDKNEGFISRGNWQVIEAERVQDAIKALGHDSFYVLEAGTKNLAVYKPNQIKSATGNIGTYGETGDIRYSIKQQLGQDTIDRINATTFARAEKGWIERLIEAISPTAVVKYRQAFLNKYEAIERLTKRMGKEYGAGELMAENSAIAAALQSDRAAGVAAASFRDGIPVFRNGYTTIDTNTKGLIPILEPLMAHGDPYIFQAFQFYAGTRRGKRLMADGREHLFTAEDIKKGDELEKQFPEFKTVFDEYQTYNAGLVKFMKDTGVISDAEAKIWTQNWDYIPFYRQMDGEKTAGPKVFSSISNISKPKELKGGTEELADFVETIVRNSRAAIESGMKNEAANRVTRDMLRAGLAEEVKTGEETSGIDIVNVKQNGKTVYYRVADPLLVESLKGLNLPQIPFLSFLAAPANVLRNFVTKDPGFMLANLGRDSLQAWITSGTDMKPLVDTFKQFTKTLSNQSPEAVALARAGLTGYDFSGDVASTARQVEKELRKRTGTRTKAEKALLPLSSFWDALEHGSHASDMATRAEVYKRTLERTGSEAEAFYQAMEVLNFSRKGNSAAVRVLSAIVPFFNARIQGLDVLYRSGWGEMATENADTMKKAFAARALTLMGLSMMYWFLVSDDDEYKKLSKEERDNYWIVPAFEVNGKPFRFPIPFELGVVFKVLPERVLETAFGSDTGKDLKESLVRNAMSTLQFNPIPQAFLPIVENVANYSFFTGEPIVGRGMEDVAPQFQVNQGTSVIAKELGESLGLSPIKIDNFIRGYTGTMGTYAVQLLDAIFSGQGQPVKATMRMEQLPVIKRFFAGDSGTVSAYYDLKGEVDEITRTMNVLERTGNGNDLKEYLDQKGKLYGLKQYVHVLDQNMKQLRQARMAINNSQTMSADEKREAIDKIHDAEVAMTFRTKEIRKRFE